MKHFPQYSKFNSSCLYKLIKTDEQHPRVPSVWVHLQNIRTVDKEDLGDLRRLKRSLSVLKLTFRFFHKLLYFGGDNLRPHWICRTNQESLNLGTSEVTISDSGIGVSVYEVKVCLGAHRRTVESAEAVASRSSRGWNSTEYTISLWPDTQESEAQLYYIKERM